MEKSYICFGSGFIKEQKKYIVFEIQQHQ